MASFHIRYWFDSNGVDRTGEQVIEALEAPSAEDAARTVQERMRREPLFTVTPTVGAAAHRRRGGSGLVLIQSAHVRYVEILPVPGGDSSGH